MKRLSTALLVFTILLISTNCFAQNSEQIEISKLIQKYFVYVEKLNYSKASGLFHYPPSYSEEEIGKDKNGVAKMLETLTGSFGQISTPEVNNDEVKILSLQIGGGDLPYWKEHPKYISTIFKVKFSKYGEGFVTFTICNISNKYEFREVKYGLAKSNKNTMNLLQQSAKILQEMFE